MKNKLSAKSLFPERLREARTRAELSQVALAEAVGIASRTIGYYESGERTPALDTLDLLAAALKTEPVKLIS